MTTTDLAHRWAITYGGDEPLNHTFYEPLLIALVSACKQESCFVCEITTLDYDSGEIERTFTGVPLRYDKDKGTLTMSLFDEDAGEPISGYAITVPVYDIVQIHIC